MQGLAVARRFTPVAMEGANTLQTSKGEIVGTPERN